MMLCENQLRVLVLFVFAFNGNINASNWHASVSTTIQSDNHYSSDNRVSVDTLISYAYDDADNDLHSRLNFLARSSEHSFQRGSDVYELSIEKGWSEYNTRIKVGRFERSDNLGYYFLDGLSLIYQNTKKDLDLELYIGKPGRIDDVRSIEGDSLFGMALYRHHKNNWDNEMLALVFDSWDIRFGLEKIKIIDSSQRINLAINTQGREQKAVKNSHCKFNCQRFKSQLMLTYLPEQNKIEDLFIDIRIPVNQDLRLRFSHEYYHPDVEHYPDFRELFYSYYAFGDQKISRVNTDYFFNKQISAFVEGIYSYREIGDNGTGFSSGIKIRKAFFEHLDLDIALSIDSIKLGDNKLDSFYINLQHHLNSRLNIKLDSIFRVEKKQRLGNNRVLGLNGKINYMAKNNLIFSFEARKINNSRLRDEHMVNINMTYYFDNYKTKRSE